MNKNHSIYAAREMYFDHLRKRNLSERTLQTFRTFFNRFFIFLDSYSIRDIREIQPEHIESFLFGLKEYRKPNRKSLSDSFRHQLLQNLSLWLSFLESEEMIFRNPMRTIKPERWERPFPRDILSIEEMKQLLAQPDIKKPFGLRNRCILEILYGSGLRSMELTGLKLADIDMDGSYLFLRGKGSKDRVVPMTRAAKRYLKFYLDKVRPYFCGSLNADSVFFNKEKRPLTYFAVHEFLKQYRVKAGIKKKVTCHTLRHTCASHLAAGGASIRYVQELLGHAEISTTQIYTRIMPVDLMKVYERTHPRCVGLVVNDEEENRNAVS